MRAKIALITISLFLGHSFTTHAVTPQKSKSSKAAPQRSNKAADATISPGSCCSAKTLKRLTAPCSDKEDCLREAIAIGCAEAIKALLEKGAVLESDALFDAVSVPAGLDEKWEWSPAGVQCRLDTVKLLLEQGLDVNDANVAGRTPLIEAVSWGRAEVAALLISKGAKVNAKDDVGQTALMKAVHGNMDGALKTVETLLASGADVNAKTADDLSALASAAYDGKTQIVALLLAKGANVNIKDGLGRTPLMLAIAAKMPGTKTITPALIQLLIDNKADLKAKNNDGETVLKFAKKYAAMYRDNSIVDLLIKAGAKE
jgi:ankyrin repeat protein